MNVKFRELPRFVYYRVRHVLFWLVIYLNKAIYQLPEVELTSIIPVDTPIASPIQNDISLPPFYAFPDHDDYTPLMKLCRARRLEVVVELGTAHGNTTANICRQCPDTKVYTVNAPVDEQTGVFVTYELSRSEIGRVYRAHGYADRVTQIFCNTLDLNLSQYFDQPVIDLAIIDACHDTDYVLNDFDKVRPFVRAGGIVLFHDTHPSMRNHLVGSYRACMILRRKGYDIRHIKGTWWAIWVNDRMLKTPDVGRRD